MAADSPPIKAPDIPRTASKVSQSLDSALNYTPIAIAMISLAFMGPRASLAKLTAKH